MSGWCRGKISRSLRTSHSSRFSAGDLMMVEVLLRLEGQLIDEFTNLMAYCDRARERPAFKRAFAAQKAVFDEASKAG